MLAQTTPNIFFKSWFWFAIAIPIAITLHLIRKKYPPSFPKVRSFFFKHKKTVNKTLDPFYTTKTVRRFGLGLPLLSEAAKAVNGHLSITSKIGEGTKIKAEFQYSHIDRQPLGNIGQTIITLVMGNPENKFNSYPN